MISVDEKFINSPCELKTMNNDLLSTAVIRTVQDDYIEIVNPSDQLPLIHCDTLVKLNIFNNDLGFRVMIGRVYLSDAGFLRIVDVQNLTDFEKRNFFRIKVNLSAKAYIMEDDLPPDGSLKSFPVHISDISLSGCFIVAKKKIDNGQRIIININLPGDIGMTICAEVQREQEVNYNNSTGYGCSFMDISSHQSDILCAYIFQEQREQIRNMREMQDNL